MSSYQRNIRIRISTLSKISNTFPQDKPYEQLATLDKLISDYPISPYADDALFTKGNTLFI